MLQRRFWTTRVESLLSRSPVVGLVGSRQVGKTTLAKTVLRRVDSRGVYLDIERASHLGRLQDAEDYLSRHADRLVVMDEVQHRPDLFPLIRALVDQNRRPGRFLLLGSASPALVNRSSETLAGRIAYCELPPLGLVDVCSKARDDDLQKLWVRGGYPESFLAATDSAAAEWRESFLTTNLERHATQFGVRVPVPAMRRFWTMLSHWQGQLWNASAIGAGLGVTSPTARHYLDVLTDACLVRRLPPFFLNVKKRLIKAPKIYVRDSGLLHALLRLEDRDSVVGHPVAGPSFEGFVVEQVLSLLGPRCDATFYRTRTGLELDLVLSLPGPRRIGVEIKSSTAPTISRGVHEAIKDTQCDEAYVVFPRGERFPIGGGIEAMPLDLFLREVVLPLAEERPRRRAKS